MVRFVHAFLFYIAMGMMGLMLFISSCEATQTQAPLDSSSALALAEADALVKYHRAKEEPPQ